MIVVQCVGRLSCIIYVKWVCVSTVPMYDEMWTGDLNDVRFKAMFVWLNRNMPYTVNSKIWWVFCNERASDLLLFRYYQSLLIGIVKWFQYLWLDVSVGSKNGPGAISCQKQNCKIKSSYSWAPINMFKGMKLNESNVRRFWSIHFCVLLFSAVLNCPYVNPFQASGHFEPMSISRVYVQLLEMDFCNPNCWKWTYNVVIFAVKNLVRCPFYCMRYFRGFLVNAIQQFLLQDQCCLGHLSEALWLERVNLELSNCDSFSIAKLLQCQTLKTHLRILNKRFVSLNHIT